MKHKLLIGSVVFIVLLAIIILFIPQSEMMPERIAGSEMVLCSSATKVEVEEYILSGENLIRDYENYCPELIDLVSVNKSGDILLSNSEFGIDIIFKPRKADESTIEWLCIGKPEKYVPKYCR